MIKWLVISIVPLFVFGRCGTTTDRNVVAPPYAGKSFQNVDGMDKESVDAYLSKVFEESSDKTNLWWIQYKQAQIWHDNKPTESCKHYKALADQKDFPLQELAFLRQLKFCDFQPETLNRLNSINIKNENKWLKSYYHEVRYKLAKENSLLEEHMDSAIAKSRSSVIQPEKVVLTKEALRIAKKLDKKDLIVKYQKRLEKLSPKHIKKPKRNDYLKVAKDYRRERNFKTAISYYKRSADHKKSSFKNKVTAWKGIARSYKLARNKEKHLKALFTVASIVDKEYRKNRKNKKIIKMHHSAQIALARALWTQGKVSKARKVLVTLASWLENKYPRGEVYWLISRMEEEKGNYKRALDFAKKSIKESEKGSRTRLRSLWIEAWNERKLGQYEEAIASFDRLIEEDESIYQIRKYKYWQANCHFLLGNKLKAFEMYDALSKEDALGYYGLLSFYQLGKKIPRISPVKREIASARNQERLPMSSDLMSKAEWLISLGEYRIAKEILKKIKLDWKNEEALLASFQLFYRGNYFEGIFRAIARLPEELKTKIVMENPEFLFPQPFKKETLQASKKFGIRSAYIYAIIRQESSFIPHARSFADAFGLMQLIPKQGKRISKLHNIPYEKPTDLYKPSINLPMGTFLMRELWDKYRGQFVLTTASYNASAKAVVGWVRTRYKGDPISWIEDIPYNETKGYIKLVLRNFIFYQRIQNPSSEIEYPYWVFDDLKDWK
ncbi:MAG: tetratricopeptide repeat protein [Bdellovibrionales bacterium]